ncbi:MAG: ribonuclease E/G [Lachnospiraceae bacterium]|nr:ribonuclease E/G [Lachnospiraceae bacterium]
MKQTVILSKYEEKPFLGILEENQLTELSFLQEDENAILGNIYIGKVKNIVQNLNAAFVEVKKDVLCFLSLKDNPEPFYTNPKKNSKIAQGDEILVQVSQMDVKTKNPMCTSKISIAGKYAAFTYQKSGIGVSSKLPKNEKVQELRTLAEKYLESHYSIVLRTNSYYAEISEVEKELVQLKEELEEVLKKAKTRSVYSLLRKDDSEVIKSIKDLKKTDDVEIVTDLKKYYDEIQSFIKKNQGNIEIIRKNTDCNERIELDTNCNDKRTLCASGNEKNSGCIDLKFYEDENLSLVSLYSLNTKIGNALKKRVWLKSGAYLVIEQTEAMVVIDVNTGKALNKKKREKHFYQVNVEAALEIARQLRLRNLSGIIIVDFIDMESEENTRKLLNVFEDALNKDRIKTTLVDITKLHLVEVTRKKIKKSLQEQYYGTSD